MGPVCDRIKGPLVRSPLRQFVPPALQDLLAVLCVGVAGAEHPYLVVHKGGEKLNGSGGVARRVGLPGEVVAGGEGVGVVGAQDAQPVGEEVFIGGDGCR